MKSYKKATLIAKNGRSGSYAAGCPAENTAQEGGRNVCKDCERSF